VVLPIAEPEAPGVAVESLLLGACRQQRHLCFAEDRIMELAGGEALPMIWVASPIGTKATPWIGSGMTGPWMMAPA
jgi:hypothetical protein